MLRFALSPCALLVGLVWAYPSAGQVQPAPALHDAYFAWDEGRYTESMEAYLEVLEGPGGSELADEVALLTGELHPVRAVDDDGSMLAVSPGGSHLLWSRQADEGWVSRVEGVEGGGRIELPGAPAAFTPGGVAYVDMGARTLTILDLGSGEEEVIGMGDFIPLDVVSSPTSPDLFVTAGRDGAGDRLHIVHLSRDGGAVEDEGGASAREPRLLELGSGHAAEPVSAAGGRLLVFQRPETSPLPVPEGVPETQTPDPGLGVMDLENGAVLHLDGSHPSVSGDGGFLAFVRSEGDHSNRILGLSLSPDGLPDSGDPELRVLLETEEDPEGLAVSPLGDRVAFEMQPQRAREIFLVPTDGSGELERVTREAQHDRFPQWVSDSRLLAMKGEFRHRRAYLYDLETGEGYRLFHNNTLRTIAPEYEWVAHPEGDGVFVVAERDGNTIAPERAVWWTDLTRTVSHEDVIERVRENLEMEEELLERGRLAFEPVADDVRMATEEVSVGRIHHYASTLYSFGTKFFTEPGNRQAIEYLAETLESWGYEVELQWWEPRGVRTANVVATLPGTRDPEIVYVISSHFDSVLRSPGADDNSSGTTALLEAARVLKAHPRSATIQFAFLSAEEAGLLGAREFVRLAEEEGKHVAGVLNNDMVGWTRSHRLDNTVRYSNPGIKDVQHAASHYFSDLITYDALYYRGTDAAVFYDVYGDVVGGIGSYPVLGNPNYHQVTDELETINQRLVAEVSRTTVASIMLMADSPARLQGVQVAAAGPSGTEVSWNPAPEAGIVGYRVRGRSGPGDAWRELDVVLDPRIELDPGSEVAEVKVRAVRDNRTEGWDWAYATIP